LKEKYFSGFGVYREYWYSKQIVETCVTPKAAPHPLSPPIDARGMHRVYWVAVVNIQPVRVRTYDTVIMNGQCLVLNGIPDHLVKEIKILPYH